ncbi:hypothetical protein HAX54_036200 [Datura stramonium]|uniref:Uncharacterized protein n=1 Tax=Datura stramonium TaxID=4076 RepID=A0ABS8VGG8_DATST|nr:hypothetical protein [Datura stramonium]
MELLRSCSLVSWQLWGSLRIWADISEWSEVLGQRKWLLVDSDMLVLVYIAALPGKPGSIQTDGSEKDCRVSVHQMKFWCPETCINPDLHMGLADQDYGKLQVDLKVGQGVRSVTEVDVQIWEMFRQIFPKMES